MADPNPKRTKMDISNGQSSSTSPKNRKIQPKLIDTNTYLFDEIRYMPGFVDHTHFIKSFLVDKKRLAIFAPRRFGKSSHLDMVRKFLQIDVDEITGEVSSSVNGPAKVRRNYKLFEETRIITDGNNKDLVENHLGKHPVIHLDFKCASINSVEEAELHCRKAVQQAYRNHSYLETSTKMGYDEEENATAQRICTEWCDDEMYKMQYLADSMQNLTRYLYNHFNKTKVYILVDELDAINAGALGRIPKENSNDSRFSKLPYILNSFLGPVIDGGWPYAPVGGVLLTGVSSSLSGLRYWYSPFDNFTIMRFLDGRKVIATDPDFVPFYGATREEVESLIQNLVKNKKLVMFEEKEEFLNDTNELDVKKIMDAVQSRYNGYFDKKGNRMFCLWSVLQYLQSGDERNYWNQTDEIQNLILKSGNVACKIIKLMRGEMIWFQRNQMTTQKLVKLNDRLTVKEEVDSEDVFNILMDQGYLTYPEDRIGTFKRFKLPNGEIRTALSNMIGDIVEKHWQFTTTSCTSLIDDITLSLMNDEKALHTKMLDVYEAISLVLRPLEQTNCALVNKPRILWIMYKVLNDAKSFELCVDLQNDVRGTLVRPDFLLLDKNDKKNSILLELKYDKYSKKDKYTTSLHALQEARGILATRNGKTKNYMNSLKKLGREALVIGLSIDSDIKVSLSYAVGKKGKIFFKSETESTSFPNLYQTANPVSLPLKEDCD